MTAAAKRRTSWLVAIASALVVLAPAAASNHSASPQKTRAEHFLSVPANVPGSVVGSRGTATGSEWFGYGIALDSSVAPNRVTKVAQQIREMSIKGWKKGKAATHFADHGVDMGFRNVTQYTNAAKELAKKSHNVVEGKVGNTIFKFDKDTSRILIVNGKDRVMKTFYEANNGLQSFKEAMKAHLDVLNSL